jgi:hypothetical protein
MCPAPIQTECSEKGPRAEQGACRFDGKESARSLRTGGSRAARGRDSRALHRRRFSRRRRRSLAEKRSMQRSGVFLRIFPDSCFARLGRLGSTTILAVCGGISDRPAPRRLSPVRTLRSLNTEEYEPCTPSLMDPRAIDIAQEVVGCHPPPTVRSRATAWAHRKQSGVFLNDVRLSDQV